MREVFIAIASNVTFLWRNKWIKFPVLESFTNTISLRNREVFFFFLDESELLLLEDIWVLVLRAAVWNVM